MLTAFVTGLGIGLASGVSPGPLLVLVMTATLRGGWRHGAASAAAPLLSDIPVVTLTLLTLGQLPQSWLGWLGVIGGIVVVGVGIQTILEGRHARLCAAAEGTAVMRRSLGQAVMVNLLSPHPWITWITVIGPLTIRHAQSSLWAGAVLVVGFYLTLVGSKVALALLVGRGRGRLTDAGYRRLLVVAGAALAVFGAVMALDFATQVR